MTEEEYTELVGERIAEWIEHSLTFENGCKRKWDEDDNFEKDEVSWMFSQKGQKLYESYLRRARKIIEVKFPEGTLDNLEDFTGVRYA